MIKLYEIPTNEQLINISDIINNELKDIRKENMYIVFELNEELLKQIDEEYFFKNNKNANIDDFTPSDEIEVIVSGVKFKFINKENEETEKTN